MKSTQIFFLIIFCHAGIALGQTHQGHNPSNKKDKTQLVEQNKKLLDRVPIEVPEDQQTKMGLQFQAAKKEHIEHIIRTVGNVTADQRTEAHVHTKINGWIEKIYADFVGKSVKKGQALFDLYSPELLSTEQEMLAAKHHGTTGKEISESAVERLRLWGVPQQEIDQINKTGKAKRAITFVSPVDGYVVNKTAIQGMYITPDMELYHIADLSHVWIIVTLYEYDIASIREGDSAIIKLPYEEGRSFSGKISYVYPEIEPETRTAKARIEIANDDKSLKPGMFTNVEIKKDLGEAIVIPDDSVIDTGTRKIVFVKTSSKHFEPREIKIGARVENKFAILTGLSEGDEVVTTSHFLIDAESKFQTALKKGASTTGHSGHGGK